MAHLERSDAKRRDCGSARISAVKSEVVCDGIRFGEGPVWCGDGTLVVTSVAEGALYRVWPEQNRATRIAETGGGANGAALASDGSILVTQNGGYDFSCDGVVRRSAALPTGDARVATGAARWRGQLSGRRRLPVPERSRGLAADGTVYFTDPPHHPPPEDPAGRVDDYWRATDRCRRLRPTFSYCNGIAFEPDGTVVVVEGRGLQRVHADGSREWVIETLGPGGGDGFCVDADGRFYVASTTEHGIRVVDPDGTIVDFLAIDGKGLTTNCCFGGDDLRTLFVTDALPGHVVAFAGMPTPGLPLPTWPGLS